MNKMCIRDSGGTVLRVRVQRLDGHGHDVPAPGLIGADVVYGALVDAYDKDVPVQRLRLLIERVGPVSYTHLDVYKRQTSALSKRSRGSWRHISQSGARTAAPSSAVRSFSKSC